MELHNKKPITISYYLLQQMNAVSIVVLTPFNAQRQRLLRNIKSQQAAQQNRRSIRLSASTFDLSVSCRSKNTENNPELMARFHNRFTWWNTETDSYLHQKEHGEKAKTRK